MIPQDASKPKEKILFIRVTEPEHNYVRKLAKENGMTINNYAKHILLSGMPCRKIEESPISD